MIFFWRSIEVSAAGFRSGCKCVYGVCRHTPIIRHTCFNKHVFMMLHVMSRFTRMPGSFIIISDENVKLNKLSDFKGLASDFDKVSNINNRT